MKKTIINENGEYCSGFFFRTSAATGTIYFAAKHGDHYRTYWVENKDLFTCFDLTEAESLVNEGTWNLCLPYEFSFLMQDIPIKYTAIKCVFGEDYYDLVGNCGTSAVAAFTRDDVIERAVAGKYILVNPYVDYMPRNNTKEDSVSTEDEKPTKMISININDVRCAAKFDIDNNSYTSSQGYTVDSVERDIIEMVENLYSSLISGDQEWTLTYTGTRSYTVMFQPEDENYGVISVLVDPSINSTRYYASVEDFLN